jgi:hypothetical protein
MAWPWMPMASQQAAALAEYVYRVGLGLDDRGHPRADLGDSVWFGAADEHALLDAVAVGLQ